MSWKRPDTFITVLTVLLILTVGWVDYWTGEELSVSILYLIPISLCTWRISRGGGFIVAGASAIVWLMADIASSHQQGHPLVPYWNAGILLASFWFVVYLLSALKDLQIGLEAKVEERTAALRTEIAEHRRTEERLTQANRELSQSREELVKAIADLHMVQLQLIEAAKMESIGRLAAGIAHEVKNPLMTITMVADYLAGVIPAGEPDGAAMLQDLRDAIQRANRVISELLSFSRPGELVLMPENVNALAERALSMVKLEVVRNHIEVVCHFSEGLPALPMDRNKIEQVLVNIYMNAIQAMSKGGTLTVRTSPQPILEQGRSVVLIEIDDTGSGIPEANLDKVFDPFFTTKPVGQGTGLGLGVSRRIIRLHGGNLELNNRPEGGLRVSIRLNSEQRN
jgi:signal transduction histidine kinase